MQAGNLAFEHVSLQVDHNDYHFANHHFQLANSCRLYSIVEKNLFRNKWYDYFFDSILKT